jgi:mono/diheme cytochrome c family protein
MKKLLFLLLLITAWLPFPVYAQTPDDGAVIFQQKCTACHTVGGGIWPGRICRA